VTVCVAVAGAVSWLAGRSLAAAFAHERMHALQVTNPWAALAAGRQAVAWEPRNSHYHSMNGDLAVGLREWDAAVGSYQSAIANDPYRASFRWRLARVWLAQGGHERQALDQLRQAVKLNPTKELYRNELAVLEESVRQAGRGLLESAPDSKEGHGNRAN
jgi:predicted Zn-dependent protease